MWPYAHCILTTDLSHYPLSTLAIEFAEFAGISPSRSILHLPGPRESDLCTEQYRDFLAGCLSVRFNQWEENKTKQKNPSRSLDIRPVRGLFMGPVLLSSVFLAVVTLYGHTSPGWSLPHRYSYNGPRSHCSLPLLLKSQYPQRLLVFYSLYTAHHTLMSSLS